MCFSPLTPQADERKVKLVESQKLQRFLTDDRDLISWVTAMKAIINADELAKDVPGAEALMERHQEHKVGHRVMGSRSRVKKLML